MKKRRHNKKQNTKQSMKLYNISIFYHTCITRLRHRSSSLNADLFRVHLANDPCCICGCAFEDAIHFILECWGSFIVWFLFACLNLYRVGAFLNCGLNLFHDLIVEGKKQFANNCNLINGFLNSVAFYTRGKWIKFAQPNRI
jgi:hypothetical protein